MNEYIASCLKNRKPQMATKRECLGFRRKKAIFTIVIWAGIMLLLWVMEDLKIEDLGFIGVVVSVVAMIVLLLAGKDWIKINSYEKIYSIDVYVESCRYVNKVNHLVVTYYDWEQEEFCKAKMKIDGIDVAMARRGYVIERDSLLNVYVGEKKSKKYYIAMKTD